MKELNYIQTHLHTPKARTTNYGGKQGYSYRSYEDIVEALKPHLETTKCTLKASDELVEICGFVYMKSTVSIKNEAGEVESACGFAKEPLTLAQMSAPQITGSISTYSRKYAICGLLAIDGSVEAESVEINTLAQNIADEKEKEMQMKKQKYEEAKKIPSKLSQAKTLEEIEDARVEIVSKVYTTVEDAKDALSYVQNMDELTTFYKHHDKLYALDKELQQMFANKKKEVQSKVEKK